MFLSYFLCSAVHSQQLYVLGPTLALYTELLAIFCDSSSLSACLGLLHLKVLLQKNLINKNQTLSIITTF